VINNEGKFWLCEDQPQTHLNPCQWIYPGALFDAGENIVEGILREVSEEAGIKVERPKLLDVFDYTSEQGTYTYLYRIRGASNNFGCYT
jgi:ADP-ribose pyrophosphatase YjhB (NUDIX family)